MDRDIFLWLNLFEKMHIHWIANTIVPPPVSLGGGDRIMVECTRRWIKDHRVTVYGNEGAKQLCDWFELKNVEHVTWPADKWKKFGRFIWWFAQTVNSCRHIKDIRLSPDEQHVIIVSSEFQPNSMPGFLLQRRYPHVPLVMESFLLAPKWFSDKPGPGFIFTAYRPFQKIVLHKVLRKAKVLLVTGEEDREFMINEGRSAESVFAVKGGVDLSIPQSVPEPPQKKYDAIFIGRLHPQKGPLELIDIWKMVVTEKKDALLAVIGSGSLEAACRAKVEKFNLSKNVEFFGFCDGIEKYNVVKASRVVVHPAVYDSGGMAAAEALCCGLPGVSFDLPALRTYYPLGWLKAPQGDMAGFADRILRLLADDKLYAAMSKDALAAGLEWDWNIRATVIWNAIAVGLSDTKPFFTVHRK